MSEINEISRAIGGLEASVQTLTEQVKTLTGVVQSLQESRWKAKGILAGIALGGGALGSKVAELLGMTGGNPPTGH
jgi:hypothetical protein